MKTGLLLGVLLLSTAVFAEDLTTDDELPPGDDANPITELSKPVPTEVDPVISPDPEPETELSTLENPEPKESRDSEAQSQAVIRDPRIAKWKNSRPQWAVEISGSLKALGGNDLVSYQFGEATRAINLHFEYQPNFLQELGVIGLGPSLSVYPIFADNPVTSSPASLWSVGGRLTYQARFFREQPIVPIAGYIVEMFNYRLLGAPAPLIGGAKEGRLLVTGPVFGAWVLLNFLEPSQAAQMYINNGISRSYVVAELRMMSGSDGQVAISGTSLFFGLRFEF